MHPTKEEVRQFFRDIDGLTDGPDKVDLIRQIVREELAAFERRLPQILDSLRRRGAL